MTSAGDKGIGIKGWLSGQQPRAKPQDMKAGQVVLDKHRIAVLPFSNISSDPENEYFADGLTEELIDRLSQVRELEVIARTSVMSYKKRDKRVAEIGRELGTGSLVEGSVRKAGNRIRVTAQLINANTEGHLWSSRYDRDLDDMFDIQSDIAQRVVTTLEARLLEGETKRIARGLTLNVQAYDEYLMGLYEMHKMADYSLSDCISHLEAAIKLDQSFAAAYASLGNAYVQAAGEENMAPDPAYRKGKQLIEKALALDETLSSAHSARGNLALQYDWDWGLAEKELRRAIELNPSNTEAHKYYSTLLELQKKNDECEWEAIKVRDLDPLWWLNEMLLAFRYVRWRRFDEAIVHAKRGVDLDPDNSNTWLELGRVYCWTDRLDEGLEQVSRSLKVRHTLEGKALLATLYAKKGMPGEATKILNEIERNSEFQYFSSYLIGIIYLALGDRDRAFELFNKSYERHSFDFIMYHQNPNLDIIRDDPRYVELLRRHNLNP